MAARCISDGCFFNTFGAVVLCFFNTFGVTVLEASVALSVSVSGALAFTLAEGVCLAVSDFFFFVAGVVSLPAFGASWPLIDSSAMVAALPVCGVLFFPRLLLGRLRLAADFVGV